MPVDIQGKEYITVVERVKKFCDDNPDHFIHTELISNDGDIVIMKAKVGVIDSGPAENYDRKYTVVGEGHGEEIRGSSFINKTSALENCETSAIGRALASAGYAGSEFASADEVGNAIKQRGDNDQAYLQAVEGEPGEFVATMGKYKGEKTIAWIAEHDARYCGWLIEKLHEQHPMVIAIQRYAETLDDAS